jgi:hypothetical protein
MISYGFGDASGQGFGNAIEIDGKSYTEYGTWISLSFEDNYDMYYGSL